MKRTLSILLICILGILSSYGQPLDGLDLTFANNGIYVGDTGGYGRVVVQPDKKIVVTGQKIINGSYVSVVQRFNDNGTIDNSFANNGQIRFDGLGFNFVNILPMYLQPDGKILVAGGADSGITGADFFIARLHPNGTFDSSFGGGGYVMTSYIHPWSSAVGEQASAITLQPDGKILAYGYSSFLVDTLHIVRYHPDGSVDSSFGTNGRVKISDGFTYPTPNDIAVMLDGRIVIGAKANIDALANASAFTAIRLLPNGELDTSFNHTGIAYTNNNLPGLLYCKAMRLQTDGKVLLVGYADSVAIVRFDTSGKLDNNFGSGGVAKITGGTNIGNNTTFYLHSDGKIYVSGQIDTANYLYRLQTDGSFDNSFALNGKLIIYGFSIGATITQQDGHILNVGMLARKTAITRLTPEATDVHDLYNNSSIDIYPNPASGNIYFDNTTDQKITQILLYSPDGKFLIAERYPYSNNIALKGLTDGIYYLKISLSDKQQITKKIIIQHNP